MQSVMVKFTNTEEMVDFSLATCYIDDEVDIKQGRYVVPAKSIMGVFSAIKPNKLAEVIIHNDTTNIEVFKKWWANKED